MRLLWGLLVGMGLTFLTIGTVQAGPQNDAIVRPAPSLVEVREAETATVDITIENAVDVYGIDLRARFDPALVEIVDAAPGQDGVQVKRGAFPQPDFVVRNSADNLQGRLIYVTTQISPTVPARGGGVVVSVTLRGRASGEGALLIDSVQIADRQGRLLPVTATGGAIRVTGAVGAKGAGRNAEGQQDQPAATGPVAPVTPAGTPDAAIPAPAAGATAAQGGGGLRFPPCAGPLAVPLGGVVLVACRGLTRRGRKAGSASAKTLPFLLAGLLFFGTLRSAEAATASVHLGGGALELEAGGTASLTVAVADVTDLYGFEMHLRFDPTAVEVIDADSNSPGVQVTPGDFLTPDFIVKNEADNQAGTLDLALTQISPSAAKNGSGTLFTVQFRGVTAGRQSQVEVTGGTLASRDGLTIPATFGGTVVTVVCIPPCSMPTPTPVATTVAAAEPLTPVIVTLPNTRGQIALPAGLVTATTTFTYSEFSAPTQAMGGFAFAGRSFTLEATDAAGQPVTTFSSRYTITLNYADTDWWAAGIPVEENLNLYHWSGAAWTPILPCAGCSLDTVNNKVIAVLDHLTEFALLGNPLAMPAVSAHKATGGVELRWTQVGNNVTRYEVYRSVKPYFAPGGTDSAKVKDLTAPGGGFQASYTDPGPFTAAAADYYVVLAIGAGNLGSPPSAPNGVFTFGLATGQP